MRFLLRSFALLLVRIIIFTLETNKHLNFQFFFILYKKNIFNFLVIKQNIIKIIFYFCLSQTKHPNPPNFHFVNLCSSTRVWNKVNDCYTSDPENSRKVQGPWRHFPASQSSGRLSTMYSTDANPKAARMTQITESGKPTRIWASWDNPDAAKVSFPNSIALWTSGGRPHAKNMPIPMKMGKGNICFALFLVARCSQGWSVAQSCCASYL